MEFKRPKILGMEDKGSTGEIKRFLYVHIDELQFVIDNLDSKIDTLQKRLALAEEKIKQMEENNSNGEET